MATVIRSELSKKNKYWIDKRRYYELKYFCLQYPLWKRAYEVLDGLRLSSYDLSHTTGSTIPGDPTGNAVEERSIYLARMSLVEEAAEKTDPDLARYILTAVTEGLTYEVCKSRLDIPCSRDTYYDRYRRFFWILSGLKEV